MRYILILVFTVVLAGHDDNEHMSWNDVITEATRMSKMT